MNNISLIGLNLKRIREEKGISAYKLSKDSGISTSTISQIETGKRHSLNSNTVEKLAFVLQISTDDLLATEDGEEYVINDLEQAMRVILSSDEVVIDDIDMNDDEKEFVLTELLKSIDLVRYKRTIRK